MITIMFQLTAKQKEHREQIRKKNYELKVLKKELEARDNDLADTKRTLNIMKDVQVLEGKKS